MTTLPFALGAYRRTAGRLPELRCVNQYVEQVSQQGTPVVLIGRPGLQSSRTVGAGPVTGLFSQSGTFNNGVLAAAGGSLYLGATALGAADTAGRTQFAGSDTEVLYTAGTTLRRTDGVAVSDVLFPDNANVTSVAYINGYFVAARAETALFYWSAVGDGTSWDALDFATAESAPDNIIGLVVFGDMLAIFGKETVEFWQPTGEADLPFQRVTGATMTKGCKARDTIAVFDNSLFWVGADGIVYRIDAGRPVRVSDYTVEERIAGTADTVLRAFGFTWQGHSFYCLTTAQGTFVFDAATGEWCEFASYGLSFWRASVGCTSDGVVILGDSIDGTLWTLSDDVLLDGADPIQRIFTSNAPLQGAPVPCHNVTLDATSGQTPDLSGQGANPVIEMRFSRDAGNTWSDWIGASLGAQGAYRARPAWRRLGLIDEPGRVFEFRLTDPAPWRLSGLRMNELAGGLSR